MAGATLNVYQTKQVTSGSAQISQTMALESLSLMNIFLALNLRFPGDTAFQGLTFSITKLLYAYLWFFVSTILLTEIRLFQTLFGTTSLNLNQWWICLIPGVILLIIEEIFKVFLPYKTRESPAAV